MGQPRQDILARWTEPLPHAIGHFWGCCSQHHCMAKNQSRLVTGADPGVQVCEGNVTEATNMSFPACTLPKGGAPTRAHFGCLLLLALPAHTGTLCWPAAGVRDGDIHQGREHVVPGVHAAQGRRRRCWRGRLGRRAPVQQEGRRECATSMVDIAGCVGIAFLWPTMSVYLSLTHYVSEALHIYFQLLSTWVSY